LVKTVKTNISYCVKTKTHATLHLQTIT